jgi:hypothetical protein
MPMKRINIQKGDINSVLLFTGDGIGTLGPRFRVQFSTDDAVEVPLTTENVEQFLQANPSLAAEVQDELRDAAKSATITGVADFHKLTYKEVSAGFAASEEVKKTASEINASDSILSPDAEGAIIYTRVPESVYTAVRESGLRSYAGVMGEERSQVIAGHDQSIFFRPGVWHIKDEEIEKGPLIGIKVNPNKVLVCNQEVRTLRGSAMELHSKYVASSLTVKV